MRSFITVFTAPHQWTIYWARWIQSTYPISLRSILKLSSNLRLGLPTWTLPFSLSSQHCIHFASLSAVLHAPPINSPEFHLCHISWRNQIMKLLIT
jgi:hypothetical protein